MYGMKLKHSILNFMYPEFSLLVLKQYSWLPYRLNPFLQSNFGVTGKSCMIEAWSITQVMFNVT